MLNLAASADIATTVNEGVLEDLKTCLASVERNLDRIGHTKDDVVAQADKMIEQARKLESRIKDLEAASQDNIAQLRTIIVFRSSGDLGYIIS